MATLMISFVLGRKWNFYIWNAFLYNFAILWYYEADELRFLQLLMLRLVIHIYLYCRQDWWILWGDCDRLLCPWSM